VTFVILFILAVLWACYLFSWLRSRSEQRSVNSISSFSKHLSVLERTSPVNQGFSTACVEPANPRIAAPLHPIGPVRRRPAIHMSLGEARRRRRDVLFALGLAALGTLLLALVAGGLLWYLQLLVDVALLGYVVLLARAQRIGAERQAKVRYLPSAARGHRPAEAGAPFLLQRSAN
jgi:hypothetical protein